ncbi:alpha/beta fold hydrolase [Nocardia farcinica]|uniref:alpha/beta fold hydrolase n=1 Tax=Nocardia farcinica TaxID=37329 RepID=UPI0020183797|nr:alpha/beta fold hydrolase [Nocardia farcinica]
MDGQTFHLVHARSANPAATPLLLNHGWPGSFVEYQRLVPLLTEEFHVVIPSPPGFGFSTPLSGTGWELARTTDACAEIMTRLGYPRFAAHGTDMGSGITGRLAAIYPSVSSARTSVPTVGGSGWWVMNFRFRTVFPTTRSPSSQQCAPRPRARSRVPRDAESPPRHDRRGAHRLTGRAARVDRRTVQDQAGRRPPDAGPIGRPRPAPHEYQPVLVHPQRRVERAVLLRVQALRPRLAHGLRVPSGWAVFDTHPLIRRALDPGQAIGQWSEFTEGGTLPGDGGAGTARRRHPRLLRRIP